MRGLFPVLWLVGCSGVEEEACKDSCPDTATTTTTTTPVLTGDGSLSVTFAIDPDYVPEMDEPPVGPFYGDVYHAADVTAVGPNAGAVAIAGIEVALVDLPVDGSPTAVLYTIAVVPAGDIVILGFIDSDGNATSGSARPDSKDPVTLPFDNGFTVQPNVDNVVEVNFGFLNP